MSAPTTMEYPSSDALVSYESSTSLKSSSMDHGMDGILKLGVYLMIK